MYNKGAKAGFIMIKEIIKNENARLMAAKTARTALKGYRMGLRTKIYATDMAISELERYGRNKRVQNLPEIKKENNNMKSFLAGLTAVTVTGAILGAAGYYLYKKYNEENKYDDILFTDDLECDCCEETEEDKMKKVVSTAADIKDVVSGAAENVKSEFSDAAENVKTTMSDAYTDVKEAIENAIDD